MAHLGCAAQFPAVPIYSFPSLRCVAGHFVPKDRPRHALDMLRSFLAQLPYNKVPRASIPAEPLCPARPLRVLD